MDKELEKTILGAETLATFARQFGDDIYAEVLVLILIEELLKDKDGK